jgi:NDP-sugar pyrophosphorylase family protein
MAGEGKRFQEAGYSFPKPLIEVPNMNGNPMIKVVVDSLGIHGKTIFVVQAAHRNKFNLDSFLGILAPECEIVEVEGITDGAACTCLLAKAHIDNGDELVVANSDQFLDWKPEEFIYFMRNKKADFGILTFPNTHPKWSYAKTDADGKILEVAEKKVISNHATVGVYYWKKGVDFVRSAERMIRKNLRVGQSFNGKGEFYVCPSFNEMIREGKSGYIFEINKSQMYGLGTPEDLRYFVDHYKRIAV